ncbi:sulfite exporter TauE/SafE family protein [Natronomonas sp. F2-12]|jgi:sulfite exporter TauE/SafE|uniref:Sulfite exporter TauE/SafE family protein n=1 Tax=Natronomonas aquatica TaxID=2841590 RepID=A0A9R1CQ31_9EURY|nr:sulfite exporter TauE/SafE family protein [Natronomonas aquatica]MCQ4332974.1 sulfite exporter TauE/SafE family protein [Natronomonas aquatica]
MLEAILRVDVLLFLAIGLLGGAHCIGMCGPLVTMYSERMEPRSDGGTARKTRRDRRAHLSLYEVRQHALFNVGRATSYTLLGAAFGALGGAVFVTAEQLTAAADPLRGVVGIAVGLFVIVAGGKYLLGGGTAGIEIPGVGRVTNWIVARIHGYVNGPGIVGLGALHGLLPCPILYPAYLFAFATGSALSGAVALASLGIGTIPAVFVYGTLVEAVDAVHRRRLHRVLGVAFLALGYVLFAHGLMALGIYIPHPMLPHYQPLGGMGG